MRARHQSPGATTPLQLKSALVNADTGVSDEDAEFIFNAYVLGFRLRLATPLPPLTVPLGNPAALTAPHTACMRCRLDQDSSGRIQYSEFLAAAATQVRARYSCGRQEVVA